MSKLGQISLYAAFVVSVMQGFILLYGAFRRDYSCMRLAKPVTLIHWLFVVASFVCLAYAFLVNDFSIRYVADTSSSSLPMLYRIPAIWAGHEGSLLLMSLVLATMSLVVALLNRGISAYILARVLGSLGLIAAAFLFLVFISNPFESVSPQADGRGMRPILQEATMIFHPLFIIIGLFGFGIVFAFAVVAVFGNKQDIAWSRWVKPWIIVSWVFLTVGIALGSWWSYHEIGWGGLWYWDPVQNISLVIWLVATALMFSVVATEKKGMFRNWTVSLGMVTFCLSVLIIYLVHSEKLLTPHAFTEGYEQNSIMLYFVYMLVGISLIIWVYGFMKHRFSSAVTFFLYSKETVLLVNIVTLVFIACTILLTTMHFFITDFINVQPIKGGVGAPYYNKVITPFGVFWVFTLGLGLVIQYKSESRQKSIAKLFLPLFLAMAIAVLLPLIFAPEFQWLAFIGLFVSSWIVCAVLLWFYKHACASSKVSKTSWGVVLGTIGLAFSLTGITLNSVYGEAKDVKMVSGESKEIFGYLVEFVDVKKVKGSNYLSDFGTIRVMYGSKELAVLNPEKRQYANERLPIAEIDTYSGIFHHIYISLGGRLGDQGAWFRFQSKPFFIWIWLGVALMSVAGLLVAFDPGRYKP
jgi:cytochrome c-type biogenesis protein CcmF